MINRSIKVVVDLQFGSTGKGLLAGYLALRFRPDTVVTAWAANAGHTYIDPIGRKYIHTMLGNGVVSPELKQILIGPGSLLNADSLVEEMRACEDHMKNVRVLIHPNAAIILQRHIDEEQGPMTKIGSTKKGVGAAAIERIRRDPDRNNVAATILRGTNHTLAGNVCTIEEYNAALDSGVKILVEGAQGYSLSMYHGMYPYTTSRDVSTAQIFADCGIPANWISQTEVIGTCRTFPIRVANRFDDSGQQVGYSGDCYPDQRELEWSELGMKAELTTVTKLPRRIFGFSNQQLREAVRQCGADSIFLNFVNYCRTEEELDEMLTQVIQIMPMNSTANLFLGFGPADGDVLQVISAPDRFEDWLPEIRTAWRNSRDTGDRSVFAFCAARADS